MVGFDHLGVDCLQRIIRELSPREGGRAKMAVRAFRYLPELPIQRLGRRITHVVRHHRRAWSCNQIPKTSALHLALHSPVSMKRHFVSPVVTCVVHLDHRTGPDFRSAMDVVFCPQDSQRHSHRTWTGLEVVLHRPWNGEWDEWLTVSQRVGLKRLRV